MEETLKFSNEINLNKPSFNDIANSVLSKVFLIRYCEEEIILNHLYQFRFDISAFPKPFTGNIYLECELFFQPAFEKIRINSVKILKYSIEIIYIYKIK